MKKCPYCGHHNEDNAEICERCYAGLPKETKPEQKEKKSAAPKKK